MSKLVENYLLQEPVGKGVYGKVFRAIHQKSKQQFAVKCIPKASFRQNPKLQQLAINQISILTSLKHENIVRFVQTLKTPNNFYFVYQFCNEGTIQSLLQKKRNLKQSQALIIFRQLLEAFKQLNKNNIMHRDLKPDNIFMKDGKVKLGDFGFCKMLEVNMAQTMLGSPIYMAPQILKEQIYTSKADIWSLGVVLFQMLFGYCPYESNSISKLINVIKQNDLVIPRQINPISQNTQILLKKMLVKDQFKRIQWVDLFDFKINQWGEIISGYHKELGIEALQKYFLNDVKSNGEISIQNKSQNQIIREITSQQFSSEKMIKKKVKQQEEPTSLKKVISLQEKKSPLMMSQNLGRAQKKISAKIQTKEFSILNIEHQQSKPLQPHYQPFYNNDYKQKQKYLNTHNTQGNKKQQSFLQKHTKWNQAVDIIQQLSQKSEWPQNQKCIYWVCKSLQERINAQYSKFPQWSDVIMQQKQNICQIMKNLQKVDIKSDYDQKNELLKMWSKIQIKNDKVWQKSIKFIYNYQSNSTITVQEILLR